MTFYPSIIYQSQKRQYNRHLREGASRIKYDRRSHRLFFRYTSVAIVKDVPKAQFALLCLLRACFHVPERAGSES